MALAMHVVATFVSFNRHEYCYRLFFIRGFDCMLDGLGGGDIYIHTFDY
jgi:hypothetical protein